jgi:hypothetical protein
MPDRPTVARGVTSGPQELAAYTSEAIFMRNGEASVAGVQALIETSALIRALPQRARTQAASHIDHRWLAAARAPL